MGLSVTPLGITYRGFRLGVHHCWYRDPPYFIAMWKSSLETQWRTAGREATTEEAVALAKECIDYNCKVEAREAVLGRKLRFDEFKPLTEM